MKFNISCPATGRNKIVELQQDEKMNELIDKKIGNEIEGAIINEIFEGYVFKIQGGFDKDGFAMKNGILTQGRKRLLLSRGSTNFRFKTGFQRTGVRKRKLVRGCIVSPEIKVLNLKITKNGKKPIPGLNEKGNEIAKLRGPKRATKILKEFGLLEMYNKKKSDKKERKTLPLMITRLLPKREVRTKAGKVNFKRPKVQRLITPRRLYRKNQLKKIKKERVKIENEQKQAYEKVLEQYRKSKRNEKRARRKQSKAQEKK